MAKKTNVLEGKADEPLVLRDTEPEVNPVEEAAKVLEEARQRRVAACREEIEAACKKHGCVLAAVPQFAADGRVVANVFIDLAQ